MGLETAHPEVLARLNKRMTIEQFAEAAALLRREDIDLRVFILVKPPFTREDEALVWAKRSLEFAFDCGATAATLIPTRAGNGALDELAARGEFSPPRLATLESAMAYGLGLHRGRVFADLWDTGKTLACPRCDDLRILRLRAMNLRQTILEPISCACCEADT
jgi:radical SAM enzyme (TIGR01210 family)